MSITMEFLGTGTSQGVPVIDCSCPICCSTDARDKRLRSSVLIHTNNQSLLIDAGPDLRTQLLNTQLPLPNVLVMTHAHQDHTAGMDDLRPLMHKANTSFPVFAEEAVQQRIKEQYSYAFAEEHYPGAPTFDLRTISDVPFDINKTNVIPIRAWHGKLPVLGFRIGNLAYLTDVGTLPSSEMHKLKNLDTLVLNALRHKPHHSHLSLNEAVELAQTINARSTYFTHISHHLGLHAKVKLPNNINLAYDGLIVS